MQHDLNVQCGYIENDLESRFMYLRTQTTNLANFFGDIFLTEYKDCEFFLGNTGTLRTNYVIEKGPFTKLTLMNIFPYSDYIALVKMKGKTVKDALENGVS